MITDIRHHLEAQPFEPFSIITSSGSKYRVPTPDHAGISPNGNRVVVWFDDDSGVTISSLHIASLERESVRRKKAA